MPAAVPTTEGRMSWDAQNAGKPCETWYRIYGDIKSGVRPLIALHGGPGAPSPYLSIFSDLTIQHNIPIIIYDQIGNGQSTHLPDKQGDEDFWTEELFLHELKQLLEHLGIYNDYDLVGHSWGGMLGARHAARQPGGLKHLVIMSSPASMDLWVQAQDAHRKELPQDVQDTLERCEREHKTDSEEYQNAMNIYYSKFLCTLDPMPELIGESFEWLMKYPTVYSTMWGPSEFFVTGTLKNWSMLNDASKISVPTLLTNGLKDEASDVCVDPFVKLIPQAQWVRFAHSSHMAHFEEREKFFDIVGNFLRN